MTADDAITFGSALSGILSGEARRGAVLISHGAGGDNMTPLLVQTAAALNEIGFLTLRWNFGYVEAGRAPSAGGKKELPEMAAAVDFLAHRAGGAPLMLLGKSFGGRLSTHIAAQRQDITALILYGLPVRGAGKNAKPRDWSHLAKIEADVLFITGDKDKLCPLDELAEVQKFLSKPFQSQVVPGDHSYKPRGEAAAVQICLAWMLNHVCQ